MTARYLRGTTTSRRGLSASLAIVSAISSGPGMFSCMPLVIAVRHPFDARMRWTPKHLDIDVRRGVDACECLPAERRHDGQVGRGIDGHIDAASAHYQPPFVEERFVAKIGNRLAAPQAVVRNGIGSGPPTPL